MAADSLLAIEVVYATPAEQVLIALEVPAGTTAGEAVVRSGILQRCPDLDAARLDLGVFGRVVPAATVLGDGDRIEIYRPLKADPKQARRRRAMGSV
jgi:putative ubiquitin-RnfH superfamily antitoxin RatB of RatAB toxin-antitoxin module